MRSLLQLTRLPGRTSSMFTSHVRGDFVDLALKGQSAVVTGASKGIGLAIARGLAAEGCSVQIVARSAATIESAADSIRKQYSVQIKVHALDLSRSESVGALLAATGTPDILVN